MNYLLDTNAVIAIMRRQPSMMKRLANHHPRDFALPCIVWFELIYGASKSQRRIENQANLQLLHFPVIPFTKEDAAQAGGIRAALEAQGQPIGAYDILIAGQAVARSKILITRNLREFSRIDALQVENWED